MQEQFSFREVYNKTKTMRGKEQKEREPYLDLD